VSSRNAAATALVVLLLTTGCTAAEEPATAPSESGTTHSPEATPTPARAVPLPPARACYRLGYDEAVAPTTDRGPSTCRRAHTSFTFAVGRLETVADGHLLAIDSRRVQAQVATTCQRRFAAFVGGTLEARRLSMLRTVWFTPTVEESDEGADWFRCDVIAVGADELLAPLTGRLAGILATPGGRDRYAMCGTAEPGTGGFERVVCSSEDAAWTALRTVPLAGEEYPGERRASAAGEAPCEAAGRAVADDSLSFRWSYEYPTEEQWEDGQTYGICWAPV
jgi:hypothetical protein